jgi:SAM-dependent methyltransferase
VEPDDVASKQLDELVERLREVVTHRRAEGRYPSDLEERLDEQFNRIVSHRATPNSIELVRKRLHEIEDSPAFSRNRIGLGSQVPGGQFLHRTAGKVVSRQVSGVLEQMQEFANQIKAILDTIVVHLEDPKTHVHADLVGQIDAAVERLSRLDRAPEGPGEELADLRRRVEELERSGPREDFHPWFKNERFEAEFRGTHSELLDRYRDLVGQLEGCDPVLDIGCGRGEFLELLREFGVEASGIEPDYALVKAAQDRGLSVQEGDAIGTLSRTVDSALGGIVLIQVVEHLSQQDLVDLIALSVGKLRAGGKLIMETVNPQSLYVFAHSFYIDPTHMRPVHPAYLTFLCREAGFSNVEIDWRSPPPDTDSLSPIEDLPAITPMVERLNRLLFAATDYAVIATR